MKPGDHPDFFRVAPPPGTSRKSTIRLDREGRLSHDGVRIEPGALHRALTSWIARHPDSGELILTNGYDWCTFEVEDAPFIVEALTLAPEGAVLLTLSDESIEALDPSTLSVGAADAVYARVKGGAFDARFSRHAQTSLAPFLIEGEPPTILVGGRAYAIGERVGR
jgi:hypothetical protein